MGGNQSKSVNTNSIYINTENELEFYLPYIQDELKKDADEISKSEEDIHFYHIEPLFIKITHDSAKFMSCYNKVLELNPNLRASLISARIEKPHVLVPIFTRGYGLFWVRGSLK